MSQPLLLTLTYALVAGFWIFGSDHIILWLGVDPPAIARLQTAKGWVFVGVTAFLLFLLLRRFEAR